MSADTADTAAPLAPLPLHALHAELGARFAPFAGYTMPIQFQGVMPEHLHTRTRAGLFDVSHMGQIVLPLDAAPALEALMPVSVTGLAAGRQRYGLLTTQAGGVADDLMIGHLGDRLLLVVNGAMKHADRAILQAGLPDHDVALLDRALLAVQGPLAEAALAGLIPAVADMRFMDAATHDWQGHDLWISRSGYTGEDGFEISVPIDSAEPFARALLDNPDVAPIGLGARDSLRLEAGMPLYGQDLAPDISPIEAGLAWAIQKIRRTGGDRAGGFPGADRILAELDGGAPRIRVGLTPEGRAPMRAGTPLFADEDGTTPIGIVTSGGFGPSIGTPIAMGLVTAGASGTLYGEVRGKRLPAAITPLPFHQPRYKR